MERLSLELDLKLNGEFHVHHHHHHSNQSQPGAADIINLIRETRNEIMTQLSDAIAQLKADDETLVTEVDTLLGKLAQVPAEIAAAVQEALTNAGVSQDAAVAVMSQMDETVRASIAKVVAVLDPQVGQGIVGVGGQADQTGASGTAPAGSATDAANAGQGPGQDGDGAAAGGVGTATGGPASTGGNSDPTSGVTSTTTSPAVGDSLVTDAGASSTVTGGQSSDLLDATQGVDTATGTGPGHATLAGGQGNDTIQTV
jgi:hypothetical protein